MNRKRHLEVIVEEEEEEATEKEEQKKEVKKTKVEREEQQKKVKKTKVENEANSKSHNVLESPAIKRRRIIKAKRTLGSSSNLLPSQIHVDFDSRRGHGLEATSENSSVKEADKVFEFTRKHDPANQMSNVLNNLSFSRESTSDSPSTSAHTESKFC